MGQVRSPLLCQTKDGHERFIDAPHLLVGEVSDEVTKPLRIDRTQLLHQHSRDAPPDVRLRPKGCRTRTSRRRSNDDDRSRKKLVCLKNDAVAFALLFVTRTTG